MRGALGCEGQRPKTQAGWSLQNRAAQGRKCRERQGQWQVPYARNTTPQGRASPSAGRRCDTLTWQDILDLFFLGVYYIREETLPRYSQQTLAHISLAGQVTSPWPGG